MTVRWTEAQLAERLQEGRRKAAQEPKKLTTVPAIGVFRDKKMNKLESAWAKELDQQLSDGKILWYKFEGIALRLADRTFYHPDFIVMENNGVIRIDETKGFMRDDANVKLKVAASLFPFVFRLIRKKGKVWDIRTI